MKYGLIQMLCDRIYAVQGEFSEVVIKSTFATIATESSSRQNKANKHETRLLTSAKQVYCLGETANAYDELFKLMLTEDNYKILAHSKLLIFLCRKQTSTRAMEIAKLFVAALKSEDTDPVEAAVGICETDKDLWIVKALLGAFKLCKVKFS